MGVEFVLRKRRRTLSMSNLRLFVLVLLTSTALLGQKYEVHLTPRNHPGDIFLFTANGTRFQQISIAGRVLKQEDISVEIEARAEVLDVDASGEPVRLALTISKFTKSEDGATSELLKPGSVVLVDGGAQDPASLKGGQLSDEARSAFNVIYSPHKPGAATDDDVFGTSEPKAFGESWPIHAERGSEDLKKSGIQVSPEHLKGKTELLSKDRVGEADCLTVRSELMASGVAMNDLPAGATLDEGTMQATLEGCVPIAGTSARKGMEMTLNARFNSKDSTVDLLARTKLSQTWQEVRK
jgi:hypothetical protein